MSSRTTVGEYASLPFPPSGGHSRVLAPGPFHPLQSQKQPVESFSQCVGLTLILLSPAFNFKDPSDYIGLIQIIPKYLPILESDNGQPDSPLPCNLT